MPAPPCLRGANETRPSPCLAGAESSPSTRWKARSRAYNRANRGLPRMLCLLGPSLELRGVRSNTPWGGTPARSMPSEQDGSQGSTQMEGEPIPEISSQRGRRQKRGEAGRRQGIETTHRDRPRRAPLPSRRDARAPPLAPGPRRCCRTRVGLDSFGAASRMRPRRSLPMSFARSAGASWTQPSGTREGLIPPSTRWVRLARSKRPPTRLRSAPREKQRYSTKRRDSCSLPTAQPADGEGSTPFQAGRHRWHLELALDVHTPPRTSLR